MSYIEYCLEKLSYLYYLNHFLIDSKIDFCICLNFYLFISIIQQFALWLQTIALSYKYVNCVFLWRKLFESKVYSFNRVFHWKIMHIPFLITMGMHVYLFRTISFKFEKNDIVMLYGDVNKSDKVVLYRLPKGTCLLNDWHV